VYVGKRVLEEEIKEKEKEKKNFKKVKLIFINIDVIPPVIFFFFFKKTKN
jgi:hypothetical protein